MQDLIRHVSVRRALVLLGIGVLVLALMPTTGWAGTQEVCEAAPEDADFDDVSDGEFADDIRCVAGYGIVDGFQDDTYRSSLPVTRGQAAKFIVGLIEIAQDAPMGKSGAQDFDDVPEDGVFAEFIAKASANGLIDGFEDNTYRPSNELRRGQMAKIVANAIEFVGVELDDSPNDSVDDVEGTIFEEFIYKLLNAEIVRGFSDGTYRPTMEVTRGQLARFVVNSAGELDDNDLWAPTMFRPVTIAASITEAFNDDSIEITITVTDEEGAVREGVTVDYVVANTDDPYGETGGNPEPDETADPNSTSFPATIDVLDPETDENGQVTFELTSASPDAISYTVFAFIGDLGDEWVDADIQSRANITVTFLPAAEDIETTATASPTGNLPFGAEDTVEVQLIDGNGDPVALAGESIQLTVTRDPGGEHSVVTGTTDSSGVATFTVAGPADPAPGEDGSVVEQTYDAIWDQDGDGTFADTEPFEPTDSDSTTYLDEAPGQAFEATLSHATTTNPYDDSIASNRIGTQHTVQVLVTDHYGDPSPGTEVDFTVAGAIDTTATRTTTSAGVASFTYSGPGESGTDIITAEFDNSEGDTQAATTSSEADELTKHWVTPAEADDATDVPQQIVGANLSANTVDVNVDLLRFTYTSTDGFIVNGSGTTMAGFERALRNVTEASTLDVTDESDDGIRTFTLLTNPES